MPRNPQISLNYSGKDRSGEDFRFGGYINEQIDLETLPTIVTDWATALGNVVDGIFVGMQQSYILRLGNQKYASDGQREERWLCSYQDNTTLATYQMELPCRKASVKPPVNLDTVDLTASPWAAFKTAFQALWVSPDGNAVTLLEVRLVGRNV